MGDLDLSGLWLEHDDGLASVIADMPPRPAKGYVTVPLAWLARVLPIVRSAEQLAILQLIYRRCLMARSRTVDLPNGELRVLGISRRTKYRALAWFAEVGVSAVEDVPRGRSTQVTLHWFP
jgi:hypothetical protein